MLNTRPDSGVAVRTAERREAERIGELVVAAWHELRDEIPPVIFDVYVDESADVAARWEEAEVLVAELDSEIAGTVTYYSDAGREGLGFPSGWAGFRTLAVDPARRGRGIGQALLAGCIERAPGQRVCRRSRSTPRRSCALPAGSTSRQVSVACPNTT